MNPKPWEVTIAIAKETSTMWGWIVHGERDNKGPGIMIWDTPLCETRSDARAAARRVLKRLGLVERKAKTGKDE